jgi:hypothetical protein
MARSAITRPAGDRSRLPIALENLKRNFATACYPEAETIMELRAQFIGVDRGRLYGQNFLNVCFFHRRGRADRHAARTLSRWSMPYPETPLDLAEVSQNKQ